MQIFSNKVFDVLKWIAIVALPALSTFFVALGPIIHWDSASTVAQIITAVAALLGALLGISTIQYNKGGE